MTPRFFFDINYVDQLSKKKGMRSGGAHAHELVPPERVRKKALKI